MKSFEKKDLLLKKRKAALKKRGFSEGGSVSQGMRGTGAAIRGTKFKGVF